MIHRLLTLLCALSLLSWPWAAAPAAPAGARADRFDGDSLDPAWQTATVLTQGPGAEPGYTVVDGRLQWAYTDGTRNAQQQVLLRDDLLPAAGEAVEVRLFPSDYPPDEHDFAGLALSANGTAPEDRTGLLLFFFEPSGNALRFWYFGDGPEQPSVAHSAAVELEGAKTLILRLVRVGERYVRAAWSTDGERFRWGPTMAYGPVRAVGVYHGNSRNPAGNRLAMDDFRAFPCSTPDRAEDYAPTTPSWTPPAAFLAEEGSGSELGWPAVRPESRPGAYWWWPGSAVTKDDVTWNLETYRRAGWGNMGAIGIYGVRGEEERFLDVFTPEWFAMFNHAVTEGKRLGMNVDLTPSSGWRMGGPHVTPEYAEQNFAVEGDRIVAKPNRAKVKRAGPGGEGLTINPYSRAAVDFHLDWMSQRFEEGDGLSPRAFYYDSFENPGNWCPEMPEAFERLRGYSLEEHAEALAGRGDPDQCRRVVCDYRETLSDLLLKCVGRIVDWSNARGSGLRMQAHGAPANLLDMYAAAEFPETEVFGASVFGMPGFRRDPDLIRPDRQSDLVNRFASSAAHVAGRDVVISESFTWLRNHFHTALAHVKAESDNLLVNGINCIYYHGICFAPEKTAWPGWLFYASTEANARNSIFRDVPALNAYITRCQSVLQEGTAAGDVLLYWPVYDLWMGEGRRELRFSVHHPEWIEATPCGEAGQWMIDRGYTFDFVSDRQLAAVRSEEGALRTAGGEYRTLLVPAATFMKVGTAERLLGLAEAGAVVLVWKHLPADVPGWLDGDARRKRLDALFGQLTFGPDGVATVGRGKLIVGDDLAALVAAAGVEREPMVDSGLKFIRRRTPSHVAYFVANHSADAVDGWIPLAPPCRSVVLMDPMTARTGVAPVRTDGPRTEVYLQMRPGDTRVLRAFGEEQVEGPAWPAVEPAGEPVPVQGTWCVEFVEGGPVLPEGFSTDELHCWTQAPDEEAKRFAGAARYTITVDVPARPADVWTLDLGDVRESARVWVNGKPAGVVVAHPFRIDLGGLLQPGANELAIEVTNLSANRIRDLDVRGVDWKKFHDINFVSHMYKPFDASVWELKPSGLLGPVTLTPYREKESLR